MKRIAAVLISSLVLTAIAGQAAYGSLADSVKISEVQTGSCVEYAIDNPEVCDEENGRHEFIELYNPASVSVDITGWRVEYLSATHDGSTEPTRVVTELSGRIAAQSYILLSFDGFIANADVFFGAGSNLASGFLAKNGSVRIVDSEGQTADLVSWGSARQIGEWPKVAAPLPSYSLQRLGSVGDFAISTSPTPQGGGIEEEECSGIAISEILPNPAGADGGNEFIEIHNPTNNDVVLQGCSLQLGTKTYAFPASALASGEYRAYADTVTGLTLPNAAGGEVVLITADLELAVRYPANLGDNISWALIEGEWRQTYKPTPNAFNELEESPHVGGKGGGLAACPEGKYRHPETNRCRNKESSPELTPCKEGQERNPATNRCRSVAVSAGLQPCKPGQERNPETNRCRSTAVTASQLTPCKPGQERNPATNRCRSTATATSSLKPCAPDQFRNPETNRCKKVDGESGNLKPCQPGWERNAETNRCRKIRDEAEPAFAVEETPPNNNFGAQYGWWIAGAAGTGAIGYGIYEWRRELANGWRRLRGRDTGASP